MPDTSAEIATVGTYDRDSECPICLAELSDPVRTPCAHVFCGRCIRAALDTGSGEVTPAGLGFCPVCRSFIASSSLMDLADGSSHDAAPLRLWGCVFETAHFDSDSSSHVSFHFHDEASGHKEYVDTDGSTMIEPFVEACYEATQRCFGGTILSYRRTTDRQLEQSWEYELWFGAGFATIERGHVHAFNGARELLFTQRLGAYANRKLPEMASIARGGAAPCVAMFGEENVRALRRWINETNPTLGEVLERMRALAPPGVEGEIMPLSLVADGNGRPLLRD